MTPDAQRFSPTVRSMLRLKEDLKNLTRGKIGNGRSASFWFDSWTDHGPLINFLGQRAPSLLRLPLKTKVADAAISTGWCLPGARSENILSLHVTLSSIQRPTDDAGDDVFLWYSSPGHFKDQFSSKATWLWRTVSWCKLVWLKQEIRRCSFISWKTWLTRLATIDINGYTLC